MNYSGETLGNVTTTPIHNFGFYSFFITLFFLTPVFIFNILLLVAIVAEKTLPGTIRFILSNIIIASEVVIFGIAIILVQNVILSGWKHLSSSLFVCRFTYVTLASGAAARLMYMATFAITVYILIRHGPAKLHFRLSFPAGILLWFFAIILNTALFSSDVFEITFHDGSICAPHGRNVTAPLYAFTYIVVYGLSSFTLGVIFPILSVCYVRKHTISGDTQMLKGMIKFAIFLLVGNSMNFIGISIPILFATFAPSDDEYYILVKAFNYVEGITLMLSLIPTPIVLLIFFKPIRHRLKKIVCFNCVKKVENSKQKFVTFVKGGQKMEVHPSANILSPVNSTQSDQFNKQSLTIL